MKNVLQIVASRGWGGGERYVYDLSEQLQLRGWKVKVIGRKSDVIASKFAGYTALPLRSMFDIVSAFKLARIIKSASIDVVHVHIFKDAFLSALAVKISGCRVKIVMTRHLVKRGKSGFMYNWLYRQLDKIIFVSNLARAEFLSGCVKVTPQKLCVVHNSIKIPTCISTPEVTLRAKYGLSADTLLLGFSGRLSVGKGVDTAIEAMSILRNRDCALVFAGVGDAKYMAELETMVENLDLHGRVFFEGFVDEIFTFIHQIDIAVLPSRWRESFGLVVLEYISQGVVVVTTNNGAQKEIIDNGKSGILIDADNGQQLADAICLIADDVQLKATLVANGIKRSEDFSIERYVDQIEEIYNQQ